VTALFLTIANADAQFLPQERPRPFLNAGLSYALMLLPGVDDGTSASRWDFEGAQQYRLTLDRNIFSDATLGITVGYAPLSLTYQSLRITNSAPEICRQGCDATADLWTVDATLRVVSAGTFHHVLELNAGFHHYTQFRETVSREQLAPLAGDRDVGCTAGYGVGWRAGRHLDVSLIGDVGFVLHGGSGQDSPRGKMNWLAVTRLVVRSGIGS
jgi:hypothetical protein